MAYMSGLLGATRGRSHALDAGCVARIQSLFPGLAAAGPIEASEPVMSQCRTVLASDLGVSRPCRTPQRQLEARYTANDVVHQRIRRGLTGRNHLQFLFDEVVGALRLGGSLRRAGISKMGLFCRAADFDL
jgi:hypothetical protein